MTANSPLLKLLSYLGLALTLVPSLLVFYGVIELTAYKWLILAGTLLWFATAPFWINEDADGEG